MRTCSIHAYGSAHDADGMDALNSLPTGATTLDKPREIIVRPSTDDDVPAMLAIYAHHIQRGLGEFDVEPLHGDDIKRRRKNMAKRRLPHLVAEHAGAVVGYAYAVPFRKRPAYRYAVKHSIYVHPDHLHSGVGRRLLPALIDACAAAGFRQMIAYIDVANEPSQRLHEAFGFERTGLLKGVGFKYGRWTDSILMQRALGPGDTAPPGAGDGTPIPQG
jgi:L-amino acid N-acyltransferase YncA